jgi:hypothetical protein
MWQQQRRDSSEMPRGGAGSASEPAPGKQTLTEGMMGGASEAAAPRAPTMIQATSGIESSSGGSSLAGDGPAENGIIGGNATTMSTADLAAAAWSNHGQFKWWIKWATDGTEGWIVQKITNTYTGSKKDGTVITNAGLGVVPSYYEAWAVDKAGVITGSLGATGNRDRWERPGMGDGSKGTWSMTGNVYWTATDPAKSGFTSRGVSNAGSLLASTSAPKDLSAELQTRTANGAWDSTTTAPTHTGAAT